MITFVGWCHDQRIAERLEPLHIGVAFEILVSRLDTARAAGSGDPMRTVSTSRAGPNSRAVTHRMLRPWATPPPNAGSFTGCWRVRRQAGPGC